MVKINDGKRYLDMPKIAVHLHLYYLEQLNDILRRLGYLSDCDFDLFVTMSELNPKASAKILQFKPEAVIWQTPNLGYDIGPFIDFLHKINLDDYDYVLKIHTKRSNMYNFCRFHHRRFSVRVWGKMLLDSLLYSPKAVRQNLALMAKNPQVGMLGNDYTFVDDAEFLPTVAELKKGIGQLGLQLPKDLHFIAGTMFLVRAKLLKPFLAYKITDFALSDKSVHKNTKAHLIERLFCLAVTAQGYQIKGVRHCSYVWDMFITGIQRFLLQIKTNHYGKTTVKVCKIPVYIKENKE